MQITANSWHYRFNRRVQSPKFTDRASCGCFTTCSYIRTTIYSVLQGTWFAFLGCIVAMLVAWIVGSMIYVPLAILFGSIPDGGLIVPAVVCWFLIACGLAVMFFKDVKDRFHTAKKKGKQPNVFVQAIVDHHNKFCTRVEVIASPSGKSFVSRGNQ